MENLILPIQRSHDECISLDKLSFLSVLQIRSDIQKIESASFSHAAKFRAWIKAEFHRASDGTAYGCVESTAELLPLDYQGRAARITHLEDYLRQSGWDPVVDLVARVRQNCCNIIQGKIEGIDILVAEKGLTQL